MLSFGVGISTQRNVGFDQCVDTIELLNVVQTVEIARKIDGTLKRSRCFGRAPTGKPRLTEALKRADQLTIGSGKLALYEPDRTLITTLCEIKLPTTKLHRAEVRQRIDKLPRVFAVPPLDRIDEFFGSATCTDQVVSFNCRLELSKNPQGFRLLCRKRQRECSGNDEY
jgi:hypothetical protein